MSNNETTTNTDPLAWITEQAFACILCRSEDVTVTDKLVPSGTKPIVRCTCGYEGQPMPAKRYRLS